VTFTIDFDSDGHAAIAYQGDDCSDNNPTIYPGAGCTRSCYIGSSYDANCICSGGTYDCGGNAGGGGATATQEKAAESHYFDSIQAGAATQLAVRNENLAVTRTLFRTNATRSAVTISIRKANDAGQVLRNAYQYLEITHSNLADSEIASAEIEFRVDLKWLNGYDEGSVSLNRYFGSRWERLPTSKTGNTSAFVYYRAHSTGLSLFAITAEKKQSLLLESKPVMQENASNATIRNGTIHIESPAAPPASIERTQLEKPSIMNEAPSAVNSQSRAWLQEGIFLLISLVVLALFAIVTFLYRSIAMAAQRTERLERYVEKRLMLGHKEQDIKGSLAELGWPEKAVHHHVRRAKEKHIADRTEHRIAERLSLGEDEQEIRRSLIGQDSSPRRIQKHIRRAKRLINE
jgi:PGF-pre-PGF domain-containing protein